MAEDVVPLAALRTDEKAHVLNDSENGNVRSAEHIQSLARIDQRQVLRRRYDNGPRQWDLLRHGELHVARARRHVDHQDIQVAPVDFTQHLRQSLDDHWPAPDDRGALVDHEAHRHALEAVADHRPELVSGTDLGAPGQTQEARLRGAIDVGVEDAGSESVGLKGQRQIDGGRRLAHTALAGRYRDQVADAGNVGSSALSGLSLPSGRCRPVTRRSVGMLVRMTMTTARSRPRLLDATALGNRAAGTASGWATALPRRVGSQHGRHTCKACNVAHHLLGSLAQWFQLLGALRRDSDREIGLCVADQHFGHEAQIDDVA